MVGAGRHSRFKRTSSEHPPPPLRRALTLVKVDFPTEHRLPRLLPFVPAALLAVVGSLAADRLLVVIGTHVFPAIKGYVHFRFSDYAKLTIVGVAGASLAWPIVTWISSAPRWLFFRLAIVVTLVLWLPDLWILAHGQPVRAVFVLVSMHLAIALVTYNALVRMAPARRGPPGATAPESSP
jgi:hypothetical protein